jgi:hypothetical protein
MNIRKQRKRKLKFVPRLIKYEDTFDKLPRKSALYYSKWCCKQCYFQWGRYWEMKHLYKHDCAQDNYDGKLKKYWKDLSKVDFVDV